MSSPTVSKLISRNEFRAVLKSVVRCLRGELDVSGLAPLTAEDILFWFRNITLEDIEKVNSEIAAEPAARTEAAGEGSSRVHSDLRKICDKTRSGDPDRDEENGSSEPPTQ